MKLKELSPGDTFTYDGKTLTVVEKQSAMILVRDKQNRLHLIHKNTEVEQ